MASPNVSSLADLPSPLHINILFKCSRHTVLLSVLPTTPFPEVGSLLLLALQSRNVSSIAGVPVPSPEDGNRVEFGLPLDRKNLKKGFVALDMADQLVVDGKGMKKKASGSKALPNENPAGAGLVDGSVLAFRFKPKDEVDTENEGNDEQGWNVELPRYDDDEE